MKKPPSCDFKGGKPPDKEKKGSRLIKHKNYSWKGIGAETYKGKASHWAEVTRGVLIGDRGEKVKFHLRYFEIAPGGFTSLERHRHEHVVIGIRGKGVCLSGRKKFRVGFLDTLYIAPDDPHQLKNPFGEPFGFFCIVDARRDRPKVINK